MAFYPYLLLALSGMGMASNVVSLFFFARQRFRRNFHRLLVILAIYDFMVGTFCLFKFHLFFMTLFHLLDFFLINKKGSLSMFQDNSANFSSEMTMFQQRMKQLYVVYKCNLVDSNF